MRRRSRQVAEARPLDGVRSMWEFVFISQFLRFFRGKLNLVHLEIEDLENAFLEDENYPIFSVFASLLRLLLGRNDVRISNWEETLKVELEERDAEPNPLEDGKYAELAPGDRVFLLSCLIDYLCDSEEDQFRELREFKEGFVNVSGKKPVGQDAQGFVYWYLDDLRLYREKSARKGSKKNWTTVCTTIEEWDALINSLQKNKENEKKLHDYLKNELFPSVEPLIKEYEKKKALNSEKKSKEEVEDSKKQERDALIKREEEEIKNMKQEEEIETQHVIDNEHRKKGRRKMDMEQESSSPESGDDIEEEESQEKPKEYKNRILSNIGHEPGLMSDDMEDSLVPRTRRKCVIMREQSKKKKEWWEEEGIGSDLEEEEDIDSDSSDGPRRRRKKPKLMRPAEPPGQVNRTFVFSTGLANRAAEAVQQGRVESIITYHRAQQTTSPYLRIDKDRQPDKNYEQQKAYFSQGYQQPGMGTMMSRGYGRIPGMLSDGSGGSAGRAGFNPAQWQQFQMQAPYMKDRQQRQRGVDDLSQILFGGTMNGNVQNQPTPGSYSQRPGMPGQQFGFPQRMGTQQQPYQDNRMQESYRPPFQQGYNQQQQYFQRPRNLPQLHSPGGQSPSSDPLGANVRSPPPPYPVARTGAPESRQQPMGNSPAAVPSPSSTGSPQTPLTPHTTRFSGAAQSPGEPSKPPFSPTNPQQSNYSASSFPGAQRAGSESSGSETGEGRPGFADLGSKGYPNTPSSQPQGFNGNHDNALQSPKEQHSIGTSKSPFLAATQGMSSSSSASMPKSFSVESLTAPSAPSDTPGHPLTSDQQMGPYSGLYYQSKYQPPAMYGGQRYQYPSTIQHTGAFYNSQVSSNMYLDRGSMPVYPPGREPGL